MKDGSGKFSLTKTFAAASWLSSAGDRPSGNEGARCLGRSSAANITPSRTTNVASSRTATNRMPVLSQLDRNPAARLGFSERRRFSGLGADASAILVMAPEADSKM